MACNHCEEFSRSHLVRRAVAEAGRGLPAIEPGMPAPAGTGLSRRSFLLRSGVAMLSVYGASKLRLADLEEGIAKAAGGTTACWSRSSSTAASTRSRCSRRPPTRPTARCARASLSPRAPAPRSARTRACAGIRPRAPSTTFTRAGKMTVAPAIGYSQPRPVALHLAPLLGGRRPAPARDHRLDGPPARRDRRRPDNPLQGLSLDGSLSPALATGSVPVAASTGPPTTSGPRASGASPRI